MPRLDSIARTKFLVGMIIAVVSLSLAIFLANRESGALAPKYTVFAYFPAADGLRYGSEVRLDGVTVGNVRAVRISKQADPDRSVEVEMRLNQAYQNIIRTDSQLGIQADRSVEITRGTSAGQVVPDRGTLQQHRSEIQQRPPFQRTVDS